MTEQDFSQKVLDDIKVQHITTKPKWEFILKNLLVWMLFILTVFIGSAAVSVIIFIFKHSSFIALMKYLGNPQPILFDLPYFWLVILLIFVFIAYYDFRHTKKGYKHNIYWVILGSVLLSVVIGVGMYYGHGGEKLEQIVYQKIPLYHQLMDQRGRRWISPDEGRLAGRAISEVMATDREFYFQLQSFDGTNWQVACDNFDIFKDFNIRPGTRLILLGKIFPNNQFVAEQIIPWFMPKTDFRPPENMFERKD